MKNKKNTVTGIIITLIITIGFIWAIYQLSSLSEEQKPLTGEEIRMNELQAYRNLKSIAEAQDKYIRQDWDSDGKKAYAMFYVHLWRSVSLDSEPIPVNLITRELAFAMEVTQTLKGYYYMDLRKRRVDKRTRKPFDYTKEWGVAACPGNMGRTGVLTFIVDQTGVIYVTGKMHSQPEYPHDPAGSGWTRIDTLQDLKKYQETAAYPD